MSAVIIMHSLPLLSVVALVVFSVSAAGAQERELGPDVRMHSAVRSKFLSTPRDVLVWTPPGYESDRERRYPVLYMNDGSNVYIEWRIDDTVKRLLASNEVEPMIIVMVPNTGVPQERYEDYTPTLPRNARFGGKADEYGRFLVEELKPMIDREYRTLPDAKNTGLGGASLGALASLYLGLKYPEVFSKLALVAPAVWWDGKLIVRKVYAVKSKPPLRIWLDVGKLETPEYIRNVEELRNALRHKGWKIGEDLEYYEVPDGKHDDVSFGSRADRMLKFLFPPKGS